MAAHSPLHFVFIPFLSPGHMLPMTDIAILFARRGIAATIITTPGNESAFRPAIDHANSITANNPINLHLLPFPDPHLLPSGKENFSSVTFSEHAALWAAFQSLQPSLHNLLLTLRPDCIVSDPNFPSSASTAEQLGIPRLVLRCEGAFTVCVNDSIELHSPHLKSNPFVVEGLLHRVEMTRDELTESLNWPDLLREVRQAEDKSFGVIINTFYELEQDYCNLFRSKPGRRAWFLGPVAHNTRSAGMVPNHLNSWLVTKPVGSVVYVCFGSMNQFDDDDLQAIAGGLEASGHPYIWVVKEGTNNIVTEGFKENGVIVKGWIPQVAVLGHAAVGGFVTHCGWNSTLEGVTAGVVMATWPLCYDQFVNERFITDVLGVGVKVRMGGVTGRVSKEEAAAAVAKMMGEGDEAERRRTKAKEMAKKARAAVEDGGSSDVDLTRVIEEVSKFQQLQV